MSSNDLIYDIKRMAENLVVQSHEAQRLLGLLENIPDGEVKDMVFGVALKSFPDFLAKAEEERKSAVALIRLNESIEMFLQEASHGVSDQSIVDGRGPAQTPQQIDPVFAEAMSRQKENKE